MKSIFLFTLFFLIGCSITKPNLEYKDARLITKRQYGEIFSQYTDPFYLEHYNDDQNFIVVKVISDVDLVYLASKNGMRLRTDAFFCDTPNDKVLLSFWDFFYRNKSVDELIKERRSDFINEIDRNDDGEHNLEYSLVINTSNHMDINYSQFEESPKFYKKFDLTKNAQDICIRINGSGFYFLSPSVKSNLIVLKKGVIEALIASPNVIL